MTEDLVNMLITGTLETLYMTFMSTLIALLVGLPLGILLVLTDKGHILENLNFNKVIGTIINIFRSFPSVVLIVVLLPLSRFIVGTTLGTNAAIVPLSIGSIPFVARIIENSLKQVEFGKIEASIAIGAKTFHIVTKVLIPEALPALIRGITIAIISIVGFTAIAGMIGSGGLGSLAIRFGYMRYENDVMAWTVIILIVIVEGVQITGDLIARLINKKRHKYD